MPSQELALARHRLVADLLFPGRHLARGEVAGQLDQGLVVAALERLTRIYVDCHFGEVPSGG